MAETAIQTKANIRPLSDRVLVKAVERAEQTKSGIYLPDTAQEKPQEAVVVAVGNGKLLDNGTRIPIDRKFGAPTVTHDGVTVAKEIELKDPFENMGAQMLKEAATKTNDVAGDGTTTSTVLAQAMVHEGMKNLAAGANPMLLKRGIEQA